MGRKYKWGILAPGKMAAKFANALKLLPEAELYAVGSRTVDRAQDFAKEHGFKKYYGSYEGLVSDKEVDIIYIASPHSFHFEHTMLCLKNKKAVLCEKAFALNSFQVERMIDEAKRSRIFLMEALWTPFQPLYRKAIEIIQSGITGEIIHLNGRFSFQAPFMEGDRKFDPKLGGGSLLDIGIYPVIDALVFLGIPSGIQAKASFTASGSEESLSVIFSYPDGRMATIYSSFRTSAGIGCDILCEKGNLFFSRGRDMSQQLITELSGAEKDHDSFMPEGMGYNYEAAEVMRCLDAGLTESETVPHQFSIDLIKTLDRIRKAAGIRFNIEGE